MTSANAPTTRQARAQRELVEALCASAFPHAVEEVRLLETHISYVLLTGSFAYKIKKALDLGFLDFTELERRRFYCEEELRLNRRLAPDIYLDVVTIGGSPPVIAGEGVALEYAVKMRQFPQSALLDASLAQGRLTADQIDALADRLAAFHLDLPAAGSGDDFGTPAAVWQPVHDNFVDLRGALASAPDAPAALAQLDELERWSRGEYARLAEVLAVRRRDGFVRECHGDLHLGNIAWLDDAPLIFDGIEFSPELRWIDVINELAFLVMDLDDRGRPDYAHRVLDRYLQTTGDYAGLQLLPFYRVYRALVRAKVASIRALQAGADGDGWDEVGSYLACAQRASTAPPRWLVLMHGFSGSGKTTVAQAVLEQTGAVRVRSDVERKRMVGRPASARGGDGLGRGIYDADTTHATYRRLLQVARLILGAGFPVVVDAASLKSWQRDLFRQEARAQRVPFRVLSCSASKDVLTDRLLLRQHHGRDASDAGPATLSYQQASHDPFGRDELGEVWFVNEHEGELVEMLDALGGA